MFAKTRNDSRASVLETSDFVNGDITVHASDWWNGEGMDFVVTTKDACGEKTIVNLSLSSQELQNIFTLALVHGMVYTKLAEDSARKIMDD